MPSGESVGLQRLPSCAKACEMESHNILEAVSYAWLNPPPPTVHLRPSSCSKVCELQGSNIFEGFTNPRPFRCPTPRVLHRPTFTSKACELQGSNTFEGFTRPFVCPPPPRVLHRPTSASKVNELMGHNVFSAYTKPFSYPPPPPRSPYEPQEISLPQEKLHRSPEKLSSHFRLGGPGCVDPPRPKTKCGWEKQKMLYGDMGMDQHSYPKPVVSDTKLRENAGHINLFGTPPAKLSPPRTPERSGCVFEGPKMAVCADKARQVHLQELVGHNAVFLKYAPNCCREDSKTYCSSDSKADNSGFKPDSGRLCGQLHRN